MHCIDGVGGVAIHQSSSIKIKVIGNYPKLKINCSSSNYGTDGRVVIISAATASTLSYCQQSYIKLLQP